MDETIQPTDPVIDVQSTETPIETDTPASEEVAPVEDAAPEIVVTEPVLDVYHDAEGGEVRDSYLVQ